jgi:23S rRNA (adenine2030-N6)-methyltransferase
MLSYRHSFHAGNHADVLKHAVLISVLKYFGQKDTAYTLVDTHAGAGAYQLDSVEAEKIREADGGIHKLREAARLNHQGKLPKILTEYLTFVNDFNERRAEWTRYPGSPAIAAALAREQDRLRFFELHSTDHRLLQQRFEKDSRVQVKREDGFAGLKALLPPPSRRGLTLIDPSYAIKKTDYRAVSEAVNESVRRFGSGTYVVWYPVLALTAAQQLRETLRKAAHAHQLNWLDVQLKVKRPPKQGFGMYGSGMFLINPPWTLPALLEPAMPVLVEALGEDEARGFILEHAIA